MADFALNIIADIEQYKRKIGEIGGITEKQATQMALAFGRQQTKMQMNAYKAAQKAANASGEAWQDAGKKLDAVTRIGEKTLGGVVGDVKDVGAALGSLGPLGGIAAAGIVGIGGAAYLAVKSVDLLVNGFIGLVNYAEDAVTEIQKLDGQDLITQEQADNVIRANAALDALSTVVGAFVAKLVHDMSPQIERTAIALTNLGFTALDLFDRFIVGKSVIEEFSLSVVQGLIYEVLGPLDEFLGAFALIDVAVQKLTGHSTGINQLVEGYRGWVREQASLATGYDGLDNSIQDLNDRESRGAKLVDELIKKLKEQAEKEKAVADEKGKASDKDRETKVHNAREVTKVEQEEQEIQFSDLEHHLAATEAAMSAHARRVDAEEQRYRDEREKREQEAADAAAKRAQEELERIEEEFARKREIMEEWALATLEVSDRLIEIGADRLAHEMDQQKQAHEENLQQLQNRLQNGKNLTKAERAELKARIEAEKAAILNIAKAERKMAAFQILLQGGIALAKAIATSPPPLNAAAIAAQAALLAVNTGAALAAPLPKVHTGTLGSVGLAPDEGLSVIRQGEVTLSQRAARQVGEVLEANRGGVGGGGGAVQRIYYNGRVMADVVGRALAEPGPARRMIEGRGPVSRGYRG